MCRCLLFLLIAACSGEKPVSGTVVEARGEVRCNGDEIGPGDSVHTGDEIEVPAQGRLELEVNGVGRVRVFASTKLELKHEPKRATLFLAAGTVWAFVTKLAPGGDFTIEGENAVAGVRGTELVVETSEDGDEVRVIKGEVDVAAKRDRNKPRRLKAGERSRVRKREAPSEPERYDSDRDRVRWNDLRDAAGEIKQGFKKAGRKIRSFFR